MQVMCLGEAIVNRRGSIPFSGMREICPVPATLLRAQRRRAGRVSAFFGGDNDNLVHVHHVHVLW